MCITRLSVNTFYVREHLHAEKTAGQVKMERCTALGPNLQNILGKILSLS